MLRNRASLLTAGILAALLVILQACGTSTPSLSTAAPGDSVSTSASTAASADPSPEASETDDGTKWDTETLKNDTGKTMIKSLAQLNGKHITFAIVSSKGTSIVADPNGISFKNGHIRADVITSTFINHDHKDSYFLQFNPDARVSEMKAESFTVKDIKVTGVAASHTGDPIDTSAPTNVVYVYEVDGLRIACFAGLDQEQLTDDQLKQIGTIDIALVSYKDAPAWHVKKEASIMILKTLKPRIVLPTEYDADTAKEIMEAANVIDGGEADMLVITADDLKSMTGTKSIFLPSPAV